eukprot:11222755-Lingulodinium_polyedra.AAC.1
MPEHIPIHTDLMEDWRGCRTSLLHNMQPTLLCLLAHMLREIERTALARNRQNPVGINAEIY